MTAIVHDDVAVVRAIAVASELRPTRDVTVSETVCAGAAAVDAGAAAVRAGVGGVVAGGAVVVTEVSRSPGRS